MNILILVFDSGAIFVICAELGICVKMVTPVQCQCGDTNTLPKILINVALYF